MRLSYRDAADVEEGVAALVATVGLDAVHLQGTEAAWTEGDLPATATRPTTARHLEYSVSIENLVADGSLGPLDMGVRGDLAVIYWYRLRGQTRRADARNAARLAADVLRAVLRTGVAGCTVVASTAYRPGRVSGEWLPVELRFVIAFDLVLE